MIPKDSTNWWFIRSPKTSRRNEASTLVGRVPAEREYVRRARARWLLVGFMAEADRHALCAVNTEIGWHLVC
jgi:hypothetical protein